MKIHKNITSLALAAGFFIASGSANATIVNINFDSNAGASVVGAISGSGQGPIAYTGTTWNNIAVGSGSTGTDAIGTNLLDSEGNATTIDINFGKSGGFGVNWSTFDVMKDYIFGGGSISIAGLDTTPGVAYKFSFIYYGGGSKSITIGSDTISLTAQNPATWVIGQNYSTFAAVAPDVSGEIAGSYTGEISGLQIEVVPEPSSAALIGLAGLGLLLRRRR